MKMYVNGEWKNGDGKDSIKKFSPISGKLLYEFRPASKGDLKEAIESAHDAFPKWSSITSTARAKIIFKAKELIERKRRELESIIMLENGKIPKEAEEEVDGVIDQLQYYAEFARKLRGDIVEGDTASRKIFQYLVPYGVVAAITPWNFPAAMVARKLAPALLTGNTVVLKPSSDTPMSAEWITRKFADAGVPKGVLNMIAGKGSEIGDEIVSNKLVSLVTMTGSTSTGQRIMEKASGNMAKLVLELGGKAPFMVWKDADLANALKTLAWAKYWNAGQSCIAAERLYVHEEVYGKFMRMFAELSRKISIGNTSSSDMGPLINASAMKNIGDAVRYSVEKGGRLLVGKVAAPSRYKYGYYMYPEIIEGLGQKSKLFQDEIFGPVIGAMKISNKDEMFDLANDSKYGLASYLFTNDFSLAQEASERIRFGELYINMPGPESSQGYHTGFRMTGQAGEGSVYGILEYLKRKNVYVDYSKKIEIPTVRKRLL
ncbi:MAG: aldehyde dehydrogenase family protein [Candidatus Micrarchaeales archaeon]|jgi:D-glyceraldehyde dehydrogenase (NADP+)|uniref:Aldehyde Dehydrogenase n=1 Tax=Candidatus Micrarchaeum acidiphilum ARMAN-2 TaxID=425595 RepID=C7DH57_MICA2|nr:MAG: Aldehyde Dehydrogenase [Candidatus Micrarchaeum acidiphilum ARMAN-2]MCW6161385.1 aldehyde dehydrogenase family protein [Candidatus Micrarchaeales archaeon]